MRDSQQTSDTVLLVRPSCFGFHAEAAASNVFAEDAGDDVAAAAIGEFDGLRIALEAAGVRCLVLEDNADPAKPDSVFPNNWVSFHGDGTMVIYPMATVARRHERRLEAVETVLADAGLSVSKTIDLSGLEDAGDFLEGTGSLCFDRLNARVFACRSPRTTEGAASVFEEATGWEIVLFDAADRLGRKIYHTNVMLMLGARFAIICSKAVAEADRERVLGALRESGRALVEVDFEQMERFACNLIELRSTVGEPVIALSQTAFGALSPDQRAALERLGGKLIAVPIPTIERVGGGSVRCMIAEVFLPRAD